MTYREIYENALSLINENVPATGQVEDYEDRAGYILATFCTDCIKADQRYRMTHSVSTAAPTATTYVNLSSAFALCDVFAPAASYYLAAMLVMDEDEEMSDRFFDLYSTSMSALLSDAPMVSTAIKDHYHLL